MTRDLFTDFSPSSKQAWLEQVAKELKGKVDPQTLHFNLWDRLEVEPFYSLEDINPNEPETQLKFHRNSDVPGMSPRTWINLVSVFPDDSNEYVLDALSNGAEGLVLHLYGMEDLLKLLKDVLPQYITILVKPLGNPVMALETFFAWVQSTGTSAENLNGALLWSPSDLVFDHHEPFDFGVEVLKELVEMTDSYSNFKAFTLQTSRYSESGANPLDAVVFGIGELIELIDKSELDPDLIFRRMMIQASVGESHFGEIARLKSLRQLISELAGLYGSTFMDEDLIVLGQTSAWSKSILDPNTNLIRQTYEAMACVLGGANLIWVRPIQEEATSGRDRRIARNVSSVLKEEAHLDKVMDPAAGSFFLGNLIRKISDEVRSKLSDMESQGGWLRTLQSGQIHTQVRSYREKVQQEIAESKLPKIGVNKYPGTEKAIQMAEFEVFEEKPFELKPTRASYLFELQTLLKP